MCSRLVGVFATMYRRKRGSSATTSGAGYCSGVWPDQSRGTGTGGTGGCAPGLAEPRKLEGTKGSAQRSAISCEKSVRIGIRCAGLSPPRAPARRALD